MIIATHGIVASQILTVPVATAATGVGSTSFTANWNAYTGATYYLLDVSTSSSFTTFVYQNQFTTSTSYVVIGLQSNTTYYYRVRASTEGDADALSFVSRIYTAGGSISYTEFQAVDTLVSQMKTDGIWTKMKAIYPMVGASAAACSQNLKSSSFTGSFSSGWTFANTGVTGNGTSAYMDTTCIPNVSLNQDSQHLCYYSRNNFDNSLISCGSGPYHQNLYIAGSFYGILSSSSFTAISISTTKGMSLISRTSSGGGTTSYWNNTNIGNDGIVSSGQYNYSLYLNARNIANTGALFSSNECAFASIGDGLTDTEASNFYTAVQTFNQALNRQVGPQIVSDADAQDYINRVYTAGGTLTDTEANAVNQLTIDMKADGIWTKMKAIYPMVGASAAACSQNLKSSSFTGSFSSGWTFASTGVTPNGTSAYMDTNYNASISGSLNSAHISIYSRTDTFNSGEDMGTYGNNGQQLGYRYGLSDNYLAFNSIEYAATIFTPTTGLLTFTRVSSSTAKVFHKNNTPYVDNQSSTSLKNANLFIGALNSNGGGFLYSNKQFAFSSIGDGLSDTEASDFYTAVQAFQTTLNRQVS